MLMSPVVDKHNREETTQCKALLHFHLRAPALQKGANLVFWRHALIRRHTTCWVWVKPSLKLCKYCEVDSLCRCLLIYEYVCMCSFRQTDRQTQVMLRDHLFSRMNVDWATVLQYIIYLGSITLFLLLGAMYKSIHCVTPTFCPIWAMTPANSCSANIVWLLCMTRTVWLTGQVVKVKSLTEKNEVFFFFCLARLETWT